MAKKKAKKATSSVKKSKSSATISTPKKSALPKENNAKKKETPSHENETIEPSLEIEESNIEKSNIGEKKELTQCTAICLNGKRCSRMAIDETGKCKQHHKERKGKPKQENPNGLSSYVMNLKYKKSYKISYKCRVAISEIYDIANYQYHLKTTYQFIVNTLFESVKFRFRNGRLPFEGKQIGNQPKVQNALDIQIGKTRDIIQLQKNLLQRKLKGNDRQKAKRALAKLLSYLPTSVDTANKNRPLNKKQQLQTLIRSFLNFTGVKYSWGNECQTNMMNAYERDENINIFIRPYAEISRLLPYPNAIDLTDIQLNLFWEAKDEYLEAYYPNTKDQSTMRFAIYNGMETTTNIFHINFNKFEVTNAIKQDFEDNFLKSGHYKIYGYEYGGEIDE